MSADLRDSFAGYNFDDYIRMHNAEEAEKDRLLDSQKRLSTHSDLPNLEEHRQHLTPREFAILESEFLDCEHVYIPDVMSDDVSIPSIAKGKLGIFGGAIIKDMSVALSMGHGVRVRDAYECMGCDGMVFDDKKYSLLLLEASYNHLDSPRASAVRIHDKRAGATITMSRPCSAKSILAMEEEYNGCLGAVVRDVLHELYEEIAYSFNGRHEVQIVEGARLRGSHEDRKMGYSRRGVQEVLPSLRDWHSGAHRTFLMGKTAYAGVVRVPALSRL